MAPDHALADPTKTKLYYSNFPMTPPNWWELLSNPFYYCYYYHWTFSTESLSHKQTKQYCKIVSKNKIKIEHVKSLKILCKHKFSMELLKFYLCLNLVYQWREFPITLSVLLNSLILFNMKRGIQLSQIKDFFCFFFIIVVQSCQTLHSHVFYECIQCTVQFSYGYVCMYT